MKPEQKFAISIFTAWYGLYIPVRQVASTRTARYRPIPPKIDSRRSISAVDGRLREKSGRLREKKGRRRRGKEKKNKRRRKPSACPRPHTVVALARGSPARRHPRIARARRRPHPREETERLPAQGERSQR
ncbi:hypothetical protein BHM03_00030602, partial [Ensete ventricosum]